MVKRVALAIGRPLPVYPDGLLGVARVEKLESDLRTAQAKIIELSGVPEPPICASASTRHSCILAVADPLLSCISPQYL
jgi:hypothetical protein